MTALEAFDLTTSGGGSDFARVIRVSQACGPYCLIGGLAVNCYVEPVYTLDAEFVVSTESRTDIAELRKSDKPQSSALRIQFTTDERYQDFPARAEKRIVLGIPVQVACLEDVTVGKLGAFADSARRLSKRKKDELDLVRLGEAYPQPRRLYPPALLGLFE